MTPEARTLDSAQPRPPWRGLALVLALGAGLRLLVTYLIWSNGGSPLIGDEGNYVLAALPLSEGRGIPDLWLWIRAPGFIFFAAGVFAVTGGSLLALNLAQVALGVAIQALSYSLGTVSTHDRALGQRAGLSAALLVCVNPLFVFSDNLFLSEPLFLLLVLSLVLCLALYARKTEEGSEQAWRWLLAAGVVAGLGLLTRPNLQLYLPLVALWLVWLHRKSFLAGVARAALFGVVAVLVVLPWSLRNLARYGHFIFVDTVGAYVLYLDNTDLPPKEVNADLLRFQNHGERQSYAAARGMEWIATHKRTFLARTANRMLTSWSADPFTDLRYPVRDKLPGTAPVLRDFYALSASVAYLLLTALAVGGLLTSPRSSVKALTVLFLVAYVITVGLSNNEFRYRLPVLGLTSAFAGFALANRGTFWPLRTDSTWRVATIASLAAGLLFALLSLPLILPGLGRAMEARSTQLASGGQPPPERAKSLERVAELDDVYSAPLRDAAAVWQEADQLDRAVEACEGALFREPGDYRARILLARLFRLSGNERKAAEVANGVPSTFNAKMQEVAWETSSERDVPGREIDIGGDDLGHIKGFHIGEREGGDSPFSYRWSGSTAAIRLANRERPRRVLVRARALPQPDGTPLKVRWKANGGPLAQTEIDGSWKVYSFDLPPSQAEDERVVILELQADARRPSAEDPRELAVAIDSVQLIP